VSRPGGRLFSDALSVQIAESMPRKKREPTNFRTPRLLQVSVSCVEPPRWQWCVSENDSPLITGCEASRETAQKEGDDALFRLLTFN
jgi:hypothetical protein